MNRRRRACVRVTSNEKNIMNVLITVPHNLRRPGYDARSETYGRALFDRLERVEGFKVTLLLGDIGRSNMDLNRFVLHGRSRFWSEVERWLRSHRANAVVFDVHSMSDASRDFGLSHGEEIVFLVPSLRESWRLARAIRDHYHDDSPGKIGLLRASLVNRIVTQSSRAGVRSVLLEIPQSARDDTISELASAIVAALK